MKCPSLLGVKLALPVAFLGKTPLSQLQIGSVCQALAWPGRQAPHTARGGMPLAGNSDLSFSASSGQHEPFQSVCVPQTPEDTADWLLAFLKLPPSVGFVKEMNVPSLLGVVENVPHTDRSP